MHAQYISFSFLFLIFLLSKDVRIGPEKVTDPAFLVSRNLEDHIDWMDKSKIKQKILEYKDKMDDYDVNE